MTEAENNPTAAKNTHKNTTNIVFIASILTQVSPNQRKHRSHSMERSHKKSSSSLLKKLESYLSITRPSPNSRPGTPAKKPTKTKKRQVAPMGCFPVYVGPEKQRFAIKTEFANHPLFKMLLEDAESEYGFATEGPLILPCGVDLFCRVLAEMEYSGADYDDDQYYSNNIDGRRSCGFAYGGCSPFNNPARRLGKGGGGSYGLLTPPRLLKINNHFY